MATQTIRVTAPLPAGTYWAYVQVDGSNTDVYGELAVTQEANGLFWTFEINAADAGVYCFQVYDNSGPLAAYGWFYSDSDQEVTIQDQNSREDALLSHFVNAPITSRMGSNYEGLLDYLATIADRLDTTWVAGDGSYLFTTTALSNAPSGGGGGGDTTVVVHPGYASWAEKIAGQELTVFHNEAGDLGPIRVQRRTGTTAIAEDVDLTELTGLYFLVVDYLLTEVYTTTSVTISGTENSQFTVPVTTELTGTVTNETKEEWHYWSLRDETDTVISTGRLRVRPA